MENKDICQICNSKAVEHPDNGADKFIVDCPRCGNYEIDRTASTFFLHNEGKLKVVKLSHYIRKGFNGKNRIKLNSSIVKDVIENFELPKPKEQADNLIIWIGGKIKSPHHVIEEPLNNLISVIGATNVSGVKYIVEYLKEVMLIKHFGYNEAIVDGVHVRHKDYLYARMTFEGWDRYYELLHNSKDSRTVFMAMAFGETKLNDLFKNTITPSVAETGFKIKRLDDEPRAGIIDNLLRVEIRKSKFLIADLTTDNRGAYWEAGYAEGLGKEVIYICEKSKFDSMHFDTNHQQTVIFEWDKLHNFAIQLKATIRATFPNEAKMED